MSDMPSPWLLLALSADSEPELERRTDELVGHLRAHPEMTPEDFADLAFTLQIDRPVLQHRRVVVCRGREDALAALAARDPRRLLGGTGAMRQAHLAFLFPGLGNHHVGMARGLYQGEPRFRAAIDECAGLLMPELGVDLRTVLYPEGMPAVAETGKGVDLRAMLGRGGGSGGGAKSPTEIEAARRLARTEMAQPAVFAVEYALATLLIDLGLRPDALLGFSIGEYVAACVAGVMSLPDALRLAARRAQLIGTLPEGAMLAVPVPEEAALAWAGEELSIAAVTGPSLSVLAGPEPALAAVEKRLAAAGHVCRRLQTTHAFHSRMMEPIAGSFRDLFRDVALHPPQIPFLSNVTGTWITAEEAQSPAYWGRHLRQTVRFADGLAALWRQPGRAMIEVGPGQTLSSWAIQHPAAASGRDAIAVPILRHVFERQDDLAFLLTALGRLWLAGVRLDWEGLWQGQRRNRAPVPR